MSGTSNCDRLQQSPQQAVLLRPALNPAPLKVPLFAHGVRAGFPSPADDYISASLDLNELLIQHKETTFTSHLPFLLDAFNRTTIVVGENYNGPPFELGLKNALAGDIEIIAIDQGKTAHERRR